MRTLDDFIELAENICKRRQIYVCGRSFYEVCAYLRGYAAAMDQSPFGVDHRTSFGTFVATRLGFPQKLGWPYVLKTASRDDDMPYNNFAISCRSSRWHYATLPSAN